MGSCYSPPSGSSRRRRATATRALPPTTSAIPDSSAVRRPGDAPTPGMEPFGPVPPGWSVALVGRPVPVGLAVIDPGAVGSVVGGSVGGTVVGVSVVGGWVGAQSGSCPLNG